MVKWILLFLQFFNFIDFSAFQIDQYVFQHKLWAGVEIPWALLTHAHTALMAVFGPGTLYVWPMSSNSVSN